MKRKLLSTAAILCLLAPAAAGQAASAKKQVGAKAAKQRAAASAPAAAPRKAGPAPAVGLPLITPTELEIRIGDIDVRTPVDGLTTAQETFDVFSPFDGRIEEVRSEQFNFVAAQEIMARMVSTEMAALLDSTPDEGRAQAAKRWKDVYKFYDIMPAAQGVVTNVYVKPKTRVYKGDRLFTVAKRVIVVGRNTERLYSPLSPDLPAELVNVRSPDLKFKARLINHIPLRDSPYFNRLWLEVLDLRSGIRIGQQFTGELSVGKNSATRLVPRRQLVESGGRKYLLMEVDTGLCTEEETEILKPGMHFLGLKFSQKEQDDGKDGQTR
ncbi:MAG: hypothetical protein COT18_01560 [Elusimicrobia bacterium CG08_land_8_20_14_0_20_59_10]|nr:MAG: hypothetical protein COT18_01560 [Elusimicrobia bacterium CG08_land_8_20_14_0_20_59_10]